MPVVLTVRNLDDHVKGRALAKAAHALDEQARRFRNLNAARRELGRAPQAPVRFCEADAALSEGMEQAEARGEAVRHGGMWVATRQLQGGLFELPNGWYSDTPYHVPGRPARLYDAHGFPVEAPEAFSDEPTRPAANGGTPMAAGAYDPFDDREAA